MELKKAALKHALQNAIQFKGKASHGAVIGRIISENPELKGMVKEVAAAAGEAVKEVNGMKAEEQLQRLQEIAPELLLERKKAGRRSLAELPNAVKGRVITRIPPEPSKYAHIGHAISFMINYLYAKKYEGKCFVRFEDTNPEMSRQEYVDAILEDIRYLGIKADKTTYASDDMEKFYSYAEKLISGNHAYVCFCIVEKMKRLRGSGEECECRNAAAADKGNWDKMLQKKFRAGEAVLRLRGDMKSKNNVMRDPVIFRICYDMHYRQGSRYAVWPLYDFENAVEDGIHGVTHILRSIEFGGMRVELQDTIKELLKLPKQTVTQYGRFNVTGALTQGREIRELISRKKVKGWDDPRLVTIKALARRGIQPKTFADLAVEVGLSPTPTNIDWLVIASFNRRYVDASSHRYFFVENPEKIRVMDAPSRTVSLKLHPSDKKASRFFSVNDEFLISGKDFYEINRLSGALVRLMDCLNFVVRKGRFLFDSLEVEKYRESGKRIIHWLPLTGNVEADVLMPDASTVRGFAEGFAAKIRVGEIVQFMRFGFCRLEKRGKGKLQFIYCHE